MKITGLDSTYNFKGATININALSDTHGHIEKTDSAYQTLIKSRAFEAEKDGKINFMITGGDWFMSGDKKGYISAPTKNLMHFQLLMYNKFIDSIKKTYPKIKSLFIPGNHDFDGGSELFANASSNLSSTIVSTNLDFGNSPALKKQIQDGQIVASTINFVSDDKNPDKKYPILNIGISPVNMKYYNKNLSGIDFLSNIPASQKNIKPSNYLITLNRVRGIIEDFKSQHPNGIVILTSHTGVNFSQTIAEEGIADIIFNAHEHKSDKSRINNVPIINLSQDFNKIVNAKIILDDNGKIQNIKLKELFPDLKSTRNTGEIGRFYNSLFREDSKKIYTIKCNNKNIKELSVEGIRNSNNNLANFVLDILLSQIRTSDPGVDIFALNSSSIRGGFNLRGNNNTSNVEILNCLTGINPEQSKIYTTDVTGYELIGLIMNNLLYNCMDKDRNPLIQYAGIRINKTDMLSAYHSGKDFSELCVYVTLKSSNKPIKINNRYRIANPIKYFEKSPDSEIKELFVRSHDTGLNIHTLFQDYFKQNNKVLFNAENRIY